MLAFLASARLILASLDNNSTLVSVCNCPLLGGIVAVLQKQIFCDVRQRARNVSCIISK